VVEAEVVGEDMEKMILAMTRGDFDGEEGSRLMAC
jgi:hypothetical protein